MNEKEKYAILKMIEYIDKSIEYTKDFNYDLFENDLPVLKNNLTIMLNDNK